MTACVNEAESLAEEITMAIHRYDDKISLAAVIGVMEIIKHDLIEDATIQLEAGDDEGEEE